MNICVISLSKYTVYTLNHYLHNNHRSFNKCTFLYNSIPINIPNFFKYVSFEGLTTRIFVRDESKVPKEIKDKVEIVVGDVLNEEQVNTAIKDVDGVVVVLGTRNDLKPTTDMSTGMKNIIAGMKANNVETVSVCLSAFLFYEPENVPKMFVDVNADHQRMYDALKDSALKYIAVFPPHINGEFVIDFYITMGEFLS